MGCLWSSRVYITSSDSVATPKPQPPTPSRAVESSLSEGQRGSGLGAPEKSHRNGLGDVVGRDGQRLERTKQGGRGEEQTKRLSVCPAT